MRAIITASTLALSCAFPVHGQEVCNQALGCLGQLGDVDPNRVNPPGMLDRPYPYEGNGVIVGVSCQWVPLRALIAFVPPGSDEYYVDGWVEFGDIEENEVTLRIEGEAVVRDISYHTYVYAEDMDGNEVEVVGHGGFGLSATHQGKDYWLHRVDPEHTNPDGTIFMKIGCLF